MIVFAGSEGLDGMSSDHTKPQNFVLFFPVGHNVVFLYEAGAGAA